MLINIPVGITPCQIDDFPATVKEGEGKDAPERPFERSCRGALYIRPSSTRPLTSDEVDWIKGHKGHKVLARRMVEVDVKVVPDVSNRPRTLVTPAQEKRAAARLALIKTGKALPMTGKRAEAAVAAAAKAKGKTPPPLPPKANEAPEATSKDPKAKSKSSRGR